MRKGKNNFLIIFISFSKVTEIVQATNWSWKTFWNFSRKTIHRQKQRNWLFSHPNHVKKNEFSIKCFVQFAFFIIPAVTKAVNSTVTAHSNVLEMWFARVIPSPDNFYRKSRKRIMRCSWSSQQTDGAHSSCLLERFQFFWR